MELLMPHDETKTLELGIQDLQEKKNNKMGFIWKVDWEYPSWDKI
jgi:hypothetical protein